MPLNIRPIAVSAAVIFFFGVAVIGWVSKLPPFTCCKRALIGAVLAYVAVALAVKAINSILINAMIANKMNQQRKIDGDSKN